MHSDMVFKCQSNYHLSASLLQSSVSHYPSEIILYADFVHNIHFFLLDFFFLVTLYFDSHFRRSTTYK